MAYATRSQVASLAGHAEMRTFPDPVHGELGKDCTAWQYQDQPLGPGREDMSVSLPRNHVVRTVASEVPTAPGAHAVPCDTGGRVRGSRSA